MMVAHDIVNVRANDIDKLVSVGFDISCWCCLPTPITLASGGSPIFSLVVHQPASPSIWPAV